ncbi:MAG: amidohydrolase family protein [Acidobacteriota bacterium]|nr:amidohydrolase family protein [Acidobacteriota bacterium]
MANGLRSFAPLLLSMFVACSATVTATKPAAVPVTDHHQHLFSPAVAAMLTTEAKPFRAISGEELMAMLDAAGIQNATVLSVAYMYGSPSRHVPDEYAKVRAENDWTGAQAAQSKGRLRAFCSFNPLKPYALDELARCAADPNLHHGIKMHFGNSDVQLDNPEHVEQLKRVFRAANEHRMAIAVHMRASISRKRPYGAAQARIFLEQLLPLASDIPVQIAHLAGSGPGYDDPPGDEAMNALAEAVARRDPQTRRLWFDVSGIARPDMPADQFARMAARIRQVGVERILYGSDAATAGNLAPREAWVALRMLPLTEAEFARIPKNSATGR